MIFASKLIELEQQQIISLRKLHLALTHSILKLKSIVIPLNQMSYALSHELCPVQLPEVTKFEDILLGLLDRIQHLALV